MGSFTEAVFGFHLRPDTPEAVLASVARLADATDPDAPPLPPPVIEDDWWPDEDDQDLDVPAWQHDWSGVYSGAMGIGCTPFAQLSWNGALGRWHLGGRFNQKTGPEAVLSMLAWWGPYVEDRSVDPDRPQLVGYLRPDGAPRPYLVWLRDGRVECEDLNPDQRWQGGSATPNRYWDADATPKAPKPFVNTGRITVIGGLPGSGKSEHLKSLRDEHPGWLVIDDFQAEAIGHRPDPLSSRHWGAVVSALRHGEQVVIADTRYCLHGERRKISRELRLAVPRLPITHARLEADAEDCRRRLRDRAAAQGLDAGPDLDRLDIYLREASVTKDVIRLSS